jgi:hypothetical protein
MNAIQREKFDAALLTKPFLQELVTRLLVIGGDLVVCWNEDECTTEGFVLTLLGVGRVTNGKTARLRFKGMEPCHCHENAIRLMRKHPGRYQRELGYALSGGTWVPHSWVWDIKESSIVETTCERKAYFGMTMRLSRSEKS